MSKDHKPFLKKIDNPTMADLKHGEPKREILICDANNHSRLKKRCDPIGSVEIPV